MRLFAHQKVTADFLQKTPRAFVTSDPGTGKTLSCLAALGGLRALVLAPLSILKPSWGEDIEKFTQKSYSVAHGAAKKREEALYSGSNIIISNHDAVNWLAEHPDALDTFDVLIVDEFTAFKNRTTKRSKNLAKLTKRIPGLWMLSGTPNSNTVLDLWYPAFLVDGGKRLGKKFWDFRSQVCTPEQVSPFVPHMRWVDKEGIEAEVGDLLKDITIRFRFEDCIDIPENHEWTCSLDMPKWLRTKYESFLETDFLEHEGQVVSSVHAGARVRKAMQILSGGVYDAEGQVVKVHEERAQLIAELIEARDQSVVMFNYHHERDGVITQLEKRGIPYRVIDGTIKKNEREEAVRLFQNEEIRVILAHPQSAAHGLTLTKGTATIWCSPTYNAELYIQGNRRIYRAGQTRRTETIRIAYKDSKEEEVYAKLTDKTLRVADLLEVFEQLTRAA